MSKGFAKTKGGLELHILKNLVDRRKVENGIVEKSLNISTTT